MSLRMPHRRRRASSPEADLSLVPFRSLSRAASPPETSNLTGGLDWWPRSLGEDLGAKSRISQSQWQLSGVQLN
ncbi:hypothetical protein J5N97_023301 [Dioscorea zingiberensis]|uniref:Uncharacterized protein n=1 Tax=Dioscorea zingiberensis TaxID=325984 RepID=A0A9D5CCI3_9LILI|nr:hypothetical protein J5N97_023301 [Dioscorea zingiberensis]